MNFIAYQIQPNQDITDIAIQFYGGLDGFAMLIDDNATLFEGNWDGIPTGTINIRTELSEMVDVDISDVKQIRQRLNGKAIATRSSQYPTLPLCGLINMAMFNQYPAQVDSSYYFYQLVVELKLPLDIIDSIVGVDYTNPPTISYSGGAGLISCLGVVDSSGLIITFEDFLPPNLLLPGLYDFDADIIVNMNGSGTCTYHYKLTFNIW